MTIVILPAFLALHSSIRSSHFCIYYPRLVVYVTVASPRSSIQAGLKYSLYIRFAEIHALASPFPHFTLPAVYYLFCIVLEQNPVTFDPVGWDCVLLVEMVLYAITEK